MKQLHVSRSSILIYSFLSLTHIMYPVQFIWGSTIICVTSKSPISQSVELLSRVSKQKAAAPGALVQCQRV